MRWKEKEMANIKTRSTITCPECGCSSEVAMATRDLTNTSGHMQIVLLLLNQKKKIVVYFVVMEIYLLLRFKNKKLVTND